MRCYRTYLALGDSILSDDYPGPNLGAASLLYRNVESHFPDWHDRDLRHRCPGVRFVQRTRTGYTCSHVKDSLHDLLGNPGETLTVLTVGGNDLLVWLMEGIHPATGLRKYAEDLKQILGRVRSLYPDCDFLVGNLYDPTDGTGRLQSSARRGQNLSTALPVLAEMNALMAEICTTEGANLVDLYSHFRGHGMRHNDPEFAHYHPNDPSGWFMFDIEPNGRGASEARGCFWRALL